MEIDPPVEKAKPTKKLSSGSIPKKKPSKIKKQPPVEVPPTAPAPAPKKPTKIVAPVKPLQTSSSNDEGEEMLNMGEEKDEKKKDTKPKPLSPEERKAAQEKRKNRVRGIGSEVSPLVRRRDGSFAFRNKELDHAKAELKKQRRDCVRDALFKHLDSPDPMSNLGIR